MAKRSKIVHSNYYICYDKSFGQSLMLEAQARGMNRSEFVRTACTDFLSRNPVNGDRMVEQNSGNPNGQIKDR